MVQRKAAHFVFNDFSSYSMLHKLNWESLEQRRSKAIITMFYKIINNLICVNFTRHTHPMTSGTRSHLNRYISLPARLINFINLIALQNCYKVTYSRI